MSDPEEAKKINVTMGDSKDKLGRQISKLDLLYIKKYYRRLIISGMIIVLVLLGYGYVHTKAELTNAKNPAAAGKTEAQQIINHVNKLLDLPSNETPTLATVKDATKLQNQSFFKYAQNGDKVLIFQKAGTALLYRPSTQKVLEYAPINLNSSQ